MSSSNRLRLLAFVTGLVGSTVGLRPSTASVCDYYAETLYGTNTSDTQHKLVQHIVCLAFEGGTTLRNVSSDITGIWRPGRFGGSDINLLPYFNGSKASTNVNNAPIGINWMDEGGPAPLADFLSGKTDTLTLTNTSNQYHLFGNFFAAFSKAFGCTLPISPPPNTGGPVAPAYAHKFMNLEYNQLGYFIHQLTQATVHYGFSQQDADTLSTRLNSLYNVRCAPAITFSPAQGPMLLSLCQNPSCPLAAPVSDCAAYVNLTANAAPSSSPSPSPSPSTAQSSSTASTSVPASTASTSPPAATSSSSSANPTATSSAAPDSSNSLSSGAIAGVAIGGAAVVLLGVVAVALLFRRRSLPPAPPPSSSARTSVWGEQQPRFAPSPLSPGAKDGHASFFSAAGQSPSEMDHRGSTPAGGWGSGVQSPDMMLHPALRGQRQGWEATSPPVEMDGVPVQMGGGKGMQQGYKGLSG